MVKRATWKPHEKHGDLTTKSDLPDSAFAFSGKRKEPLTDEVREQGVANIVKAAKHYGVEMTANTWRDLSHAGAKG